MAVTPSNTILALRPDLTPSNKARLAVWHTGSGSGHLSVEVREPDKEECIWHTSVDFTTDSPIELPTTNVAIQPWSPEAPNLYDVRLHLNCGEAFDDQTFRIGFRRIESTPQTLLLNGIPLHLRGAVDPVTCRPAKLSDQDTRITESRFQVLKGQGFNLVRCRDTVLNDQYLTMADRIGLFVWWELPAQTQRDENESELASAIGEIETMITESAIRDAHHASLVIRSFSAFTRAFSLASSKTGRAAVRSLAARARDADSSRLIVDSVVAGGSAHVDTDLVQIDVAPPPPGNSETFAERLAVLASRPPWLWSRADANLPGHSPVIASLQRLRSTADAYGDDWARRFEKSPAGTAFTSHAELRTAIRRFADKRHQRQLADLCSTKGLNGYVISEERDNDRIAGEESVSVAIRGLPSSTWEGDSLNAILLRSAGTRLTGDLEITWSFDGQTVRKARVASTYESEPAPLDDVRISAPSVDRIRTQTLCATVKDVNRTHIATAEVVVIPESLQVLGRKMRVFVTGLSAPDQIGTLANTVAEVGCTVLTAPTRTAAVVAVGGGPAALAEVQAGAPGLVLAEAHDTEFLPTSSRNDWHEDEIVDWLAPGTIPGLPLDPLLGPEFGPIAARRVIPALDGLNPKDVLMGTFRGALRDEAALTAQARYGNGKAVITTLLLAEAGRSDPLGRALVVALLRYVTSEECAPSTHVEGADLQAG